MNEYESLLIEIKLDHTTKAKEFVPKLCYTLKKQDPLLADKDIGKWVKHDLIDIWSPSTIYENLPEEFKDEEKSKQTKEGIKQKNVRERSPTAVGGESSITISTDGQPIDENPEPPTPTLPIKLPDLSHHHEISREELELENGRLKEMLEEQREQIKSLIESVNKQMANKKDNLKVEETPEFMALKSELMIITQERDEYKQVASKEMKEHPEQTFQSASTLPSKTETEKAHTWIKFAQKEHTTYFMDSKNAKEWMYLKLEGTTVVAWESDYIRQKRVGRTQ